MLADGTPLGGCVTPDISPELGDLLSVARALGLDASAVEGELMACAGDWEAAEEGLRALGGFEAASWAGAAGKCVDEGAGGWGPAAPAPAAAAAAAERKPSEALAEPREALAEPRAASSASSTRGGAVAGLPAGSGWADLERAALASMQAALKPTSDASSGAASPTPLPAPAAQPSFEHVAAPLTPASDASYGAAFAAAAPAAAALAANGFAALPVPRSPPALTPAAVFTRPTPSFALTPPAKKLDEAAPAGEAAELEELLAFMGIG